MSAPNRASRPSRRLDRNAGIRCGRRAGAYVCERGRLPRLLGVSKMPDAVTPDYLLKGAVYSLEQCGVLLCDADLLYRRGAYASCVVLAAFAREALGQWKILLDLREEVIGGKTATIPEIKDRCSDHVQKQKAGMLSVTMRGDHGSGSGKLLMSRMEAQPRTEEWTKTNEALEQIVRKRKKAIPAERHEQRAVALYVDPISVDRWNRPSKEISKAQALTSIVDARNDYVIQFDRYTSVAIIQITKPDLFKALERWPDRPELPVVPMLMEE